jgi:uncharacterized protein YecE (DUF72 family)
MTAGTIRVGIGGWTFPPWRGTFYPEGLPHARELDYAAGKLTAIEINGTYYRLRTPKSFAAWAKAAPPGFVFSVKASRFCTNRKKLAEAGESVEKFLDQGLVELGGALGPILWQFMATKPFDPDDFAAFLSLLPARRNGVTLRHAIEPRHDSFRTPEFVALARKAGVAIVFADKPDFPTIADPTADFVYARLQTARDAEPEGYSSAELDRWADIAARWAAGKPVPEYPAIALAAADAQPRDVFVFMINGAKIRAPAAAQALLNRLDGRRSSV